MSKDKKRADKDISPESINDKSELIENGNKKKKLKNLFSETWFMIVAPIVAVIVIATVVIWITVSTKGITLGEVFGFGYKRIDYINSSLDKYIDPSPEDYKNVELELNVPKPTEADVDEAIIEKLAAAAKDAGKVSIYYQYNTPVSAGDAIYFYYAAYLLDENGNRIKELTGLNNCADYGRTDRDSQKFVVGSGNFGFLDGADYELDSSLETVYSNAYIRGFEKGLIGAIPSNFKFYTTGDVDPEDIVYATATYVDDTGLLYDKVDVRIDLGDENCESIWGEGIYDYITEKQIGDENFDPITLTCTGSGKKLTFTNFVVNYVSDDESGAHKIVTTFPYDHPDEGLRNATVGFDIFIEKTEDYATPEFTDAFVTDYLKLTEEKLSGYTDCASMTEKCRAYYMDRLTDTYNVQRSLLAEELIWEKLKENVEIKKLPEREVIAAYQDYLFIKKLELAAENEAGAGYEDIDEFMEADLGLEVGADWEGYVYGMIEEEIVEKLIFYSVLKKENKLAVGEEFESFCRAELENEYWQQTGKRAGDFETAEEYESEIAALRANVVAQCGGEAGFTEEMYYRYGSGILLGFAILKDVA